MKRGLVLALALALALAVTAAVVSGCGKAASGRRLRGREAGRKSG